MGALAISSNTRCSGCPRPACGSSGGGREGKLLNGQEAAWEWRLEKGRDALQPFLQKSQCNSSARASSRGAVTSAGACVRCRLTANWTGGGVRRPGTPALLAAGMLATQWNLRWLVEDATAIWTDLRLINLSREAVNVQLQLCSKGGKTTGQSGV